MHALSSEHEHEDARAGPRSPTTLVAKRTSGSVIGRERKQEAEHEPSEGSDYPARRCRRPSPRARLGRPDEQPARPRAAAGRSRRCARSGARGRGHGARLRADGRALPSASGSSVDGRSGATAAGGVAAKARRPGVAGDGARRWAAARPRARPLRPRARPRLERRHGRRGAAAHPALDDVRLRVGDRPAHGQLPAGAGGRRARGDPARAPGPLRRRAASCSRYPGLKEEYYLADFAPDPAVLDELGLDAGAADRRRAHAAGGVALPPLRELAVRRRARPPARPRPGRRPAPHARAARRARRAGGFTVPERAIDAQSLIAFADLVVSAGGTMNREAVALGTPVYTTFEGRLGAVDERLIAEGRLRRLERAGDLELVKRPRGRRRARPRATRPLLVGTARARRSGGLPQLAAEHALGPQPPLGGQAPELGRRARAGQVAGGGDLGRRERGRSAARCPRRRAARRSRSPRPRRPRRAARRGRPSRRPRWRAGRSPPRPPGRNSKDGNGTRRRCSVWVSGAAARVRSRSARERLGDRRGLQVDPEALDVQAGHAPGGLGQRVGVVHALWRSNIMPSRTTRRYGPSRPCSAAALTAWQAGYDDRGGASSQTRGSIGIPLAAHASSTWCMVSTGLTELPCQSTHHVGERQRIAEFGLEAAQPRLRRPRPRTRRVGEVRHMNGAHGLTIKA